MTVCLFCRIVRGDIPAEKVAEDSHCLAFRDIAPAAPVHVLVVPKRHFTSLNNVEEPGVHAALLGMAREVARLEGIAESGYRCVINTREDGGQSVDHLHLHVLGGRRMTWPPG